MRLVIQLLLWVVILVLGYLVFNSIYEPTQFNDIKEERYATVVERLEEIRDAQLAYRDVTGRFTGDFDSLTQFLDTAEFVLTQRRDTTVLDEEYKRIYKVDNYKEIVVVDTLGYASIKDSLFGGEGYESLRKVPIEGVDAEFQLEAGMLNVKDNLIPVFEAKVAKEVVLHDQDSDLIRMEEEVVAADQINGAYISVGSMEEVNTTGNWPTLYGSDE